MKNTGSGKTIVFFVCALLLLHIPVAFSKPLPFNLIHSKSWSSAAIKPAVTVTASSAYYFIYDSLKLDNKGLSQEAFTYALQGYEYLRAHDKLGNSSVMTIIDFSKSSAQKRMYIIDMNRCKILFHTYVAHGQNSGLEYANRFSNKPESLTSSLGFYVTSGTYMGKHGYSLQLRGLEKGINDRAFERDIVIHGADYVSEDLIRAQGYLGRSWGCPAVSEKLHRPIIDKIKNGSCIFIYAKDKNYLAKSRIL
ncbi:MAG: murein L,D-transpeptidase catalytic domain family protein [Ferruginibacter sp.]